MTTEAYRLPDLLALLPEKPGGEINPHFKEFEAAFNAWVEKTLGGPRVVEVYQSENPLFVAVLYPLASQHQLRGIIDYFAAGLLLDDLLHVAFHLSLHMCSGNLYSDRSPSEDVRALSQLWMKTLQNGNEGRSVQHPLIEMMRSELLVTIRPVVGSFHWSQFVAENNVSVKYMAHETDDWAACQNKNAILDIQSYMIKLVLKMEDATTEMMLITHDIYSFKREYGFNGALTNLLTVMQNDPETAHLDFQGRLDYAEKLFKAALDNFQACRSYHGLIDMAIGNVQWSRINRRYSTFTSNEDRRSNIVRLALDGSPENEKAHVPIL
ncbi:hypothetical protein J3R83DRAFT_7577 [Lanmaoa asiatica]|nr:hypothetical protein J3R83DRAFT_7577 [Lanmaoa asiatica]